MDEQEKAQLNKETKSVDCINDFSQVPGDRELEKIQDKLERASQIELEKQQRRSERIEKIELRLLRLEWTTLFLFLFQAAILVKVYQL
ncbi:MAG: hypothetical protein AAFQ14_02465 [Cyanobacteria bacterium J06621_12]